MRNKSANDPLRKNKHKTNLCNKLEGLTNRGMEEDWQALRETIKEVAEELPGTKWLGGNRKTHNPWWTEEVREAVGEKVKKLRK